MDLNINCLFKEEIISVLINFFNMSAIIFCYDFNKNLL